MKRYCLCFFVTLLVNQYCLGQQAFFASDSAKFEQWTCIGVGFTYSYNFTSLRGTAPQNLKPVATPTSSIRLTLRKDFSRRLAGEMGIGYSEYAIRTTDGFGRLGFFRQHIQIPFYLQYNLNTGEGLRKYVRLGFITHLNPHIEAKLVKHTFRRITSGQPTIKEEIEYLEKFYAKIGITGGIGLLKRNKWGWLIDISLVYHMGLQDLLDITYTVYENKHGDISEKIYQDHLHQRASFIGVDTKIYIQPFGWKKLVIKPIN